MTASLLKLIGEARTELKAATPQNRLFIATAPRPRCGAILAKVMEAMNEGGLCAEARGIIMSTLGQCDPAGVRQAQRDALAQLEELQNDSVRGGTPGQAATLVREARALLEASNYAESAQLAAKLASVAATIGEA